MILPVIVLHALGVALCLYTLRVMWVHQVLVGIVLTHIPLANLLGGVISMWIVFALIAAIASFGLFKILSLLRVWWRGETIDDAADRLRIGIYVAMGCLGCCVFVLSTPESFSGPFRLRFPVAAWMTASLAYGVWCALPKFRLRFSSRTRHFFDLVAMNAIVTLVLAEIVLLIASMFFSNPILITDSTSSQIRRDSERMEPGSLRFSFPINSRGHYDTEFLPPEERSKPLVVTIGDSFSYGVVPHHYHYTTVAEREFPGAEIYNIGFPGTGPTDYLHLLVEEALPLKPDLVVIALYVGNDVVTEDTSAPPNRWYDAQSYMVGIVWHRLQILRRAQGNDWTQDSPETIGQDLVSRYPWLGDPMLEQASLGEDIYFELESRNAFVGAANLPGVYERFFAVLQNIEDAAADVPVAFLIIPDEYQVEDALWEIVVEKNELPLERQRPQRRLREWAQSGNHEIVDLLPPLLAAQPLADGQRHVYHLRDTHINARGNAIAGRELAKFIESKFAEPEPGTDTTVQLKAEVPIPRPTTAEPTVSLDDAVKILQRMGTVISSAGVNGTTVFDTSLLHHPKDEIKAAILVILSSEFEEGQKKFANDAALILAFFQPGVGESGVPIDSNRSDQQTWRSVVEAEMLKIRQEILSATEAKN